MLRRPDACEQHGSEDDCLRQKVEVGYMIHMGNYYLREDNNWMDLILDNNWIIILFTSPSYLWAYYEKL